MQYEVIESKVWKHESGHVASIYGSKPHGEGWAIVQQGWTVRNPITGQVGVGRVPWQTKEEAQAYAAKIQPSRIGYGD